MSVYVVIDLVFKIIYFAILARVVLSWIPHDRYHPAVQFIERATDPFLRPFQRLIPPEKLGGIDISPLIAFIVLSFVEKLILTYLV
ncbi:MAG: YggT family protein [Candidatus Margulisiibacteriota bacterium]